MRAKKTFNAPDEQFGRWSMNFVGIEMGVSPQSDWDNRWYVYPWDEGVKPSNLHEAQRDRRLRLNAAK